MKKFFTSSRFKLVAIIAGLLVLGMLIAAVNGHGTTAQSGVIGTVFAPAHWVADKISNTISRITDNAGGNTEYQEEIDNLQRQLGDMQDKLADYDSLQKQNQMYKEALELKEENKNFKYVDASVIGRDSADVFNSFTISKGSVSGIKQGDAVLYGKYLIGTIKKVYPTYSIVTSIIHPDFSVSAYDINSDEVSYVTGDSKLSADGYCKFENLDSSTNVTYGSIIATEGISSTIPRGIIIGTVEELDDEATNISTYAVIKPGTDINKVKNCLVLTGYQQNGGE